MKNSAAEDFTNSRDFDPPIYNVWKRATQQEIADAVDMTQQAIATWESDFTKNSAAEDFVNDRSFDPPISNV